MENGGHLCSCKGDGVFAGVNVLKMSIFDQISYDIVYVETYQ
jgi:hypothetical protein